MARLELRDEPGMSDHMHLWDAADVCEICGKQRADIVLRAQETLDALAEYDEGRNDMRLLRALQRLQGDEGEEA